VRPPAAGGGRAPGRARRWLAGAAPRIPNAPTASGADEICGWRAALGDLLLGVCSGGLRAVRSEFSQYPASHPQVLDEKRKLGGPPRCGDAVRGLFHTGHQIRKLLRNVDQVRWGAPLTLCGHYVKRHGRTASRRSPRQHNPSFKDVSNSGQLGLEVLWLAQIAEVGTRQPAWRYLHRVPARFVAQAGMRSREGRDASAVARFFLASVRALVFSSFFFLFFLFFLFSLYHFLRCMFIHAARGAYHPTAAGRAQLRHPFRTCTSARAPRVRPAGDAPPPTAAMATCRPPAAGRPCSGLELATSATPHPHSRSPSQATDLVGSRRGVGATSGGGPSTRPCRRGTRPTIPAPPRCLCRWRTRRIEIPHSRG